MTERNLRGPGMILACGGLILALSLGLRHGLGLFLQPISMDSGWERGLRLRHRAPELGLGPRSRPRACSPTGSAGGE